MSSRPAGTSWGSLALPAGYGLTLLLGVALGAVWLDRAEPSAEQRWTTAVADASGAFTGSGLLRREPGLSYGPAGKRALATLAMAGALSHMVFGSLAALRLWRSLGWAGGVSKDAPSRAALWMCIAAVVLLIGGVVWSGGWRWATGHADGFEPAWLAGVSDTAQLGIAWDTVSLEARTAHGVREMDLLAMVPAAGATSLGAAVLFGWLRGWRGARRAVAWWLAVWLLGVVLLASVTVFGQLRAQAGIGITSGAELAEPLTTGTMMQGVGQAVHGATDARSIGAVEPERDAERFARWVLAGLGGATGGAAGGLGAVWLSVVWVGRRGGAGGDVTQAQVIRRQVARAKSALLGLLVSLGALVGAGAFALMLVEGEGPGLAGWLEAAWSAVTQCGLARGSVLGVGGVTRFGAGGLAGLAVLGRWVPIAWMCWAAAGGGRDDRTASGGGPY
ncbi:MAG: hypothetical protein AAF288_05275 [Planctomycetota bacterium]